jgi:hypothetical protein
MVQVLCNPVATQPYMNLPLKNNSVNDISVNAQNPSNTGVATTTGIFGETDGAMEFDGAVNLIWASSIGNEIAAMLNSNITMVWYEYINSVPGGFDQFIGQDLVTDNNRSFRFQHRESIGGNTDAIYCWFSAEDGSPTFSASKNNVLEFNEWIFNSIRVNGSNFEWFYNQILEISTTKTADANESSDGEFYIGLNPNGARNTDLKILSFRIYQETLNDGELAVINQQQGRVK